MTKSELIERISEMQPQLSPKDVELAVKTILEQMSDALATGQRIEIRGLAVSPYTIVHPEKDVTLKQVRRLS